MAEEDVLAASERRVAWLRIAAVGLIAAAERLPHPNPNERAFTIATVAVLAYALAALAYAYVGAFDRRLVLAAIAVDVASISVLAYLSGGAFSNARLAYFLIPISVAFRFQWRMTVAATAAVVLAYNLQAINHPARHVKHAYQFLGVQTGYLVWIGAAAALFSGLLATRTQRLIELARGRKQLLADVMSAEERERRELAEGLHDHAIQNLLVARQDLEEAMAAHPEPELERTLAALTDTLADLRGAIFELHPHVLQQAGLEPALKAVAERASRHGGFDVDFSVDYPRRHPDEALLLGAARELLANVSRHARAGKATVTLAQRNGATVLTIADDGVGFDPATLGRSVADAHIGLLSQRERIEASGGRLEIESAPGRGTTVTASLPTR
ncbi:MAG TPA: ATP-binding protein [Gaiellaceae bacterium]|nr:ATP-binding protein [Gaiellaceae bacterium]